jgi:uncharacterized protein
MEGHLEINVSQLMKSTIGSQREYDFDDLVDILDLGVGTRVKGQVRLTRTNRGILVQGKLSTKIPLECSRCLEVFDLPLSFELEEEYFPVIDVNSGTALEIPDDGGNLVIDEHHLLELNEAVRQNALLSIPMKPLCKNNCAGICTECGANLNEKKCGCLNNKIDPRWSKLIKLNPAAIKSNKKKKENK